MKKGLVLEGGAMRGVYTAGVLDVLMEKGIEADGGSWTGAYPTPFRWTGFGVWAMRRTWWC